MDVLASVDFAVLFWRIAFNPAPEKASSLPSTDAAVARVQAVHMLKASDCLKSVICAGLESRRIDNRVQAEWLARGLGVIGSSLWRCPWLS